MVKTLPDFLGSDLRVLAIGINPSLPAVRAGFPFANPRNRFWPALNRSRLVHAELTPGVDAMRYLCRDYGIGFTDIVKRPSAGMRDLTAADYRAGAPVLARKIEQANPAVLWFHGMVAVRAWLRLSGDSVPEPVWGLQPRPVGGRLCYVSPNPSPANARYALTDIVASYDALAGVLADAVAAG